MFMATLGQSHIHLNPARARLFELNKGRLSVYRWTSYVHSITPLGRPGWLEVSKILEGCIQLRNAVPRCED